MLEKKQTDQSLSDADVERRIGQLTRRSFAVGAGAGLTGFAGWFWLRNATPDGDLPWPLRRILEINERLAGAYFKETRSAPAFPPDQAREPRVNGEIGLAAKMPANWKLHVDNGSRVLTLSLADIQALPRVEMVTELKCVEGWSEVVQWAGVRLVDFAARYKLGTRSGDAIDLSGKAADVLRYVGFATPDQQYYVGFDAPSAFHPQTLLAYEMNSQPLTAGHGAPLRLITAVKYGYKSLKCIGTISFTDRRPPDYWAERGYDWYAGH
jgi:DMSO/TMAO reductase YedYZ molybdopterin-dependent catalytic subunit